MSEAGAKQAASEAKLTKKQVRAYLADIEKKVIDREGADMASLVALNALLKLPNAEKLLDDDLRQQIKDLWIKLKANGMQVDDPPLLFGLPEDFGEEEVVEEEELGAHVVAHLEKSPPKQTPPEEDEAAPADEDQDIDVEEEDQEFPH